MKTAVILAGGLGTRLYPVTREIPKPLIPVQGRTLLEHVLDILKEHGIEEVILSLGYRAEQIRNYFGDGERFGVRMKYIIEQEPLGTAGWMKLIAQEDMPAEDFIVVNGDNLFDMDFHEALDVHRRNNAVATIGLTLVEEVQHFGVVEMQGDRILRFVEKPKPEEAPSNKANSGYYIFSPEIFNYLPEAEKFMFEKDIFPAVAADGRLAGYPSSAQWFDTGTFERWEKVIAEWRRVPSKSPEPAKPLAVKA